MYMPTCTCYLLLRLFRLKWILVTVTEKLYILHCRHRAHRWLFMKHERTKDLLNPQLDTLERIRRWSLSPKTPSAILANEWCLQTHGFNITANCFFANEGSLSISFRQVVVPLFFVSYVSYVHVFSEWDTLRMMTTCLCSFLYSIFTIFNCIQYSVFMFGFVSVMTYHLPVIFFKNIATWTCILFLFGQRSLVL